MALKINKKDLRRSLEQAKRHQKHLSINNSEVIARCYYWLGHSDSAREWFFKTYQLIMTKLSMPSYVESLSPYAYGNKYISAANMLFKAGRTEKAESLLLKAIDLHLVEIENNPASENAWGKLAECHFILKQYDKVMADLEEIYKIEILPYRRYDVLGLFAKASTDKDKDTCIEALGLIEKSIKGERLRPYQEGDTISLWDRYEWGLQILKKLDPASAEELGQNIYR